MPKRIAIIGSGLAGSLLCNALVKHANVTLLEAGPKESTEYPKVEFVRKEFGVVKTFCLGGGGTTNLWHNGLIPLNIRDIQSKEFASILDEARAYIDRAAADLFFTAESYSSEYDSVRAEMSAMVESLGVFSDGIDCLLYPKKFKRLRVDQRADAFYNVSNIEFKAEKGKIEMVSFSVGPRQYNINPDIVIVCAGTLGSPRLVSKVLSAAGRSYEYSGVGLADHPMGFVGKVKIKKEVNALFGKLSTLDRGDYIGRTAVRLTSECGRYACCAFFRPALTMQNELSIYKYKSKLGASSGMDLIKNALSFKILHPDILAEIYSHLFGVQIRSRIYNILLLFEQKRGKSRVFYNGDGLKIDWSITAEEIAVYNGMLSKLQGMLEQIADELILKMPLPDEWLWSAAHHSGTIPLGDHPEDLVDKNLKLKCCDNVFVCDGSIIQEHSYANTGLTIGQLALRLAEHILK
jgi:hypothetical protein